MSCVVARMKTSTDVTSQLSPGMYIYAKTSMNRFIGPRWIEMQLMERREAIPKIEGATCGQISKQRLQASRTQKLHLLEFSIPSFSSGSWTWKLIHRIFVSSCTSRELSLGSVDKFQLTKKKMAKTTMVGQTEIIRPGIDRQYDN